MQYKPRLFLSHGKTKIQFVDIDQKMIESNQIPVDHLDRISKTRFSPLKFVLVGKFGR
jgi:hypothetical protein